MIYATGDNLRKVVGDRIFKLRRQRVLRYADEGRAFYQMERAPGDVTVFLLPDDYYRFIKDLRAVGEIFGVEGLPDRDHPFVWLGATIRISLTLRPNEILFFEGSGE